MADSQDTRITREIETEDREEKGIFSQVAERFSERSPELQIALISATSDERSRLLEKLKSSTEILAFLQRVTASEFDLPPREFLRLGQIVASKLPLAAPIYRRNAIMRDAHKRFRDGERFGFGWSFGRCLSTAWAAAKASEAEKASLERLRRAGLLMGKSCQNAPAPLSASRIA